MFKSSSIENMKEIGLESLGRKRSNMVRLSELSEKAYQNRMKELESNIWQILTYQEHYMTIRGIYAELKSFGNITKRQAVRLFDFIYDCEFDEHGNVKFYSKEAINEAFDKIKKLHVFERVEGGTDRYE